MGRIALMVAVLLSTPQLDAVTAGTKQAAVVKNPAGGAIVCCQKQGAVFKSKGKK